MSSQPRVLLVPGPPEAGKIENGVDRYLDALVSGIGGRVEYTYFEDPNYARQAAKQCEDSEQGGGGCARQFRWISLVPQDLRLLVGYVVETFLLAAKMRQYSRQVDMVHLNRIGCEVQTVAAWLAGFRRIVATVHNLPDEGAYGANWVRRLVEKCSFACADLIIMVSDATCSRWQKRVPLEKKNVVRIYLGMNPPAVAGFDRRAYRRKLGIDSDAFVVGICARLHRMKGHLVLIDAFARLLGGAGERWPGSGNIVLLIAGDGPERSAIEKRLEGAGLGGRVRLLGHRADPAEFMAALDVHVLPSVSLETLGYSSIEAMFAGVPPVVSDIGGMKELVQAAGGGRVVPAGDAVALCDAIRFYVDNPGSRVEEGDRVRRFAVSSLSAAPMADLTLSAYMSVLGD